MPDMKSELAKVISVWETQETPPEPAATNRPTAFTPTNNVTRTTFDHILHNPGKTRPYLIRELEAKGYKKSSTSSIITQMLRQGLLRETNNALYTTQPEYTPLKPRLVREAQKARVKAKLVRSPKPTAEAPVPATPAPAPVATPTPTNIPALLESLNILQARALYDELRKIFGG